MTLRSDQVPDPDPYGFKLVWLPGSGSESGSALTIEIKRWIRTETNADPHTAKKKEKL